MDGESLPLRPSLRSRPTPSAGIPPQRPERYRHTRWKPNPLSKLKLSAEEARTQLARRFFRWIGPATMAEFQWFTGEGVKACQAAVEPLELVPAGKGSERLLLPGSRDAFEALGRISDLPSHAILDRGRIVGLWEYDPESASIAWSAWVRDKALTAAVERTEAWVQDQLGDARSFSLDSPKSRAPRIRALRA